MSQSCPLSSKQSPSLGLLNSWSWQTYQLHFFEALLAEELAGVLAERGGLDGVVTGAATWAVTTAQGGLTTLPPEALIGGRGGMVSVGGTSASNMPWFTDSNSAPSWESVWWLDGSPDASSSTLSESSLSSADDAPRIPEFDWRWMRLSISMQRWIRSEMSPVLPVGFLKLLQSFLTQLLRRSSSVRSSCSPDSALYAIATRRHASAPFGRILSMIGMRMLF